MASRALKLTYRNAVSLKDPRHLLRFLKSETGMDIKDIAKAEGVSVAVVRRSIHQVDAYRQMNTTTEMDYAVRNVVISAMPQVSATLHGLLTATELVEVKIGKTGKTKVVKQDDKTTRIEAVRLASTLVRDLQPKTPSVVIPVTQNNAVANISKAETTEERFQRLRERAAAHNLLPPEVAAVPDYIDQGGTADDEDSDDEDEDDED